MQPDNMRPFSIKHAQQQASIVGHMHQAGLLQVKNALAVHQYWDIRKMLAVCLLLRCLLLRQVAVQWRPLAMPISGVMPGHTMCSTE